MAEILSFPTQTVARRSREVPGPCQILLFTGVRVEYRDRPEQAGLARRVGRGRRPARRAN